MQKLISKIFNIKYLILLFVCCFLFFAYLQWSPSFADPDSFYHAKAAALMGQEGTIKSFPWLPFTSFSQNFTDQHFLYHLLLLPFILIFSSLLGTKIFAVLLAALTIFFFYFFLKRWDIRWPWFYVLILLSIPAFIFRLNLAKAGPLSLIILLIGLSLIWQKKYWALGILSFLYVWTHGGWILLIILAACHLAAELMIKRSLLKNDRNFQFLISNFKTIFKFLISNFKTRIDWKLIGSIVIGLIAGLIINPYFPHNLQFYWEQVVQIGFWNYQDIIPVGMEWYPYKMGDFVAGNAFGLILAIGALAAFFWRAQLKPPLNPLLRKEGTALNPLPATNAGQALLKEGVTFNTLLTKEDTINCPLLTKEGVGGGSNCPLLEFIPTETSGKEGIKGRFQKILTLLLFSGILLVMTLKSQRFIEYFAPFFILANAFLLNFSLPKNFSPWPAVKNFFTRNLINKIIIIYLAAVWLIFFVGKNWDLRQQLTRGFDWHYLQGASQWLSQNTPSRSLVFHSGWSDFPMLFYHNDHNVYIAGMDPTFFYHYDRELYQKWTEIIQAQEPRMAEMIKNDFGADFILIKLKEKLLLEKVEKDPAFVLRYGDGEARVFEIK